MMKKVLLLISIFLLAACERSATTSNWSPINDATPSATGSLTSITSTQEVTSEPSAAITDVYSTPDFDAFPKEFAKSMKGYELMSWQEGDQWFFTLVTGTNREKTFEEIMAPGNEISDDSLLKVTVTDVDQLKKVIDHLPKGESIIWSGMDLSGQVPEGTVYFSFPEQIVIDDLIQYCKKREITLYSLKEPE